MIPHLDHILTFLSLAGFVALAAWWFGTKPGGKQ